MATAKASHSPTPRKKLDKANEGDYAELSRLVKEIVKKSSHWERFGYDQCVVASAFFLLLPAGFLLLRFSGVLFAFGLFLLGAVHMLIITKASHSAAHYGFCATRKWNEIYGVFFSDVCGAFTYFGGKEAHVNMHHPHTNVIGLGDSSIWKVPTLGRVMYLFVAPFFLPFIAPLFSLRMLWGRWTITAATVFLTAIGFMGHFMCFKLICGLSTLWSLACLVITRSMFYCSYIHVNIFQHIGLSMYHPDRRPKRLRLMATGVLNLARNPFLDYCFGHSLISCHIEHHLFPQLSDNMCMKIKPTVQKYIEEKQLPYFEDSYWNRLKIFFRRYTELMVNAPPITDFIGIQ